MKTAGTSIESCLSRCLPTNDCLSPIKPPVDCHTPRNWILPNNKFLYNHMPMREIIDIYGSTILEYQSWCIERHPIDKCISHYAMLINSKNHNKGNDCLSWDEYIQRRQFPIDIDKWTVNESITVNRIFDYNLISNQIPDYLFSEFGISSFFS